MNSLDDDPVLKDVRERYRKQDPSLKLTFHPQQFIIGNYSPRLKHDFPLVLQHNTGRRISLRFKVDENPLVGYPAKDFGVALTQIDSISVKDECQDNLPALVMTFKQECMRKLWDVMPGMREACEKSYIGEDRALARNVTFILRSFPTQPDVFCKIEFRAGDVIKEHHFDFDVCKQLLLKDIKAVWLEMISDQWNRRQTVHLNRTYELIREMSNHSWVEYLTAQKLLKSTCASGETMYIRSDDNPAGRRMPPKGRSMINDQQKQKPEYKPANPTALRLEKRSVDALKGVTKSFGQRREGAKPVAKRVNPGEIFFEPTYTDKVRLMKVRKAEVNNGSLMEKPIAQKPQPEPSPLKNVNTTIDLSETLQVPMPPDNVNDYQLYSQFNQYPTSGPSAEEYITREMRNLGNAVEDVEMAIPGLSGDYSLCQQYSQHYDHYQNSHYQQNACESSGHQVAAAGNGAGWSMAAIDEQTANEQVLAEFFYPPTQTPIILQDTPQGDTAQQVAPPKIEKQLNSTQEKLKKLVPKPKEKDQTQQIQNKKSFVVAKASPSSNNRSVTQPSLFVSLPDERKFGDTPLFTFPPKHLAVAGIDPVVLSPKDVRTLDRKEFVNDNVMSFMLNYIAVYMIDKNLMSKILMNNTFFYSNLTRGIPVLSFNKRRPADPAHQATLVKNCARVFRWTRKYDVFKKDYIVIPINEDFHWLLVTVFNPAGAIVDMSNEQESRAAPKCYVAFFDPLSGLDPVKRNHMCHCVTTYLSELYKETKAPGKPFAEKYPTVYDEERVIVTRPSNTPIQSNFFDCGLYAIHFIEGLFCYLDRPVTVHDFPDFDWSQLYPKATEMADLMRDKIYNLVLHVADKQARSRLSYFERRLRHGLSQEGALRRARRHSAVGRLIPRHPEYRARHYSVSPPNRNVMEDPMFSNPRGMAEMPITQKVRTLRLPEENFPVIY